MASKSDARLLPLSCSARKHRSVKRLRAATTSSVAVNFEPSQSAWSSDVGSVDADLSTLDSSTPRFASLSSRTLCRHTSKVGAVCVNALVRICAGGDQRWSSLPRHLETWGWVHWQRLFQGRILFAGRD